MPAGPAAADRRLGLSMGSRVGLGKPGISMLLSNFRPTFDYRELKQSCGFKIYYILVGFGIICSWAQEEDVRLPSENSDCQ